MLREMGVEGDRAWLRGWKEGREQVAMATGRFEGVEERGTRKNSTNDGERMLQMHNPFLSTQFFAAVWNPHNHAASVLLVGP